MTSELIQQNVTRQILDMKDTLNFLRREGGQRVTIDQIETEIALKTALLNSMNTEPRSSIPVRSSLLDCGGGGDCFYRCLSKFIFYDPDLFVNVRNDMATWLSSNPYYFATTDLTRNLNLSEIGKWIDGEVEILIAAETYGINIMVLTDKDDVHEFNLNKENTCYLYNQQQVHYQLFVQDS
jgi:hypothetical protein